MKKQLIILLAIASVLIIGQVVQAQDNNTIKGDSTRSDLLYSMSSFGFAFPVGQTSEYFKAKFSTALGVNIGLGKNGGWFLYPKISLQSYSYNEIYAEEGYSTRIDNGRATTYLGNFMLGYRAMSGKFAFYGFAGGGGGLILTPQIKMTGDASSATLNNRNNWMATAEGGAGIEYSLGGAALFIESSYLRGFTDIQGRTFNAVPVYIGIKPNLSKLLLKPNSRKKQ